MFDINVHLFKFPRLLVTTITVPGFVNKGSRPKERPGPLDYPKRMADLSKHPEGEG